MNKDKFLDNAYTLREVTDRLNKIGFNAINPSAYYMYADLYDKTDPANILHIYIQGNAGRFDADFITWQLEITTYGEDTGRHNMEFKKQFTTFDALLDYLGNGGHYSE